MAGKNKVDNINDKSLVSDKIRGSMASLRQHGS